MHPKSFVSNFWGAVQMKKIKVLLSQIDDVIVQDKVSDLETVSFTPSLLTKLVCELRRSLE